MNATETVQRQIRVLIGKPGLDGHDVGARIVVRALRDAGMEVIYTGLRQSPEAIAQIAADEDVDVVGLSILSGAHLSLSTRVREQMTEAGLDAKVMLLVGGNIPQRDWQALEEAGVNGIFPTDSDFDEIVRTIRDGVRR